MAIVWDDVIAIAPELSTIPLARQAVYIAIVDAQVDPNAWGKLVDIGKRYLAAHLATMSNQGAGGASAGTVSSESVGSLSRSYATPQDVEGGLGQSIYGAEYRRLMKIACPRWLVVP